MAWPLFFLALLSYCSSVTSQPTVTQPASSSVALGQTVKISCAGSNGGNWHYLQWHQQKPRQAPRFMAHGASRGEGIPDRFTGSSSVNPYSLTISNTEADDEAGYFCLGWEDNSKAWVFGGGTQLTVLGQPTAPPTVNLYPPSPEELKSSEQATLVCLINGFYPSSIEVDWEADGTPISSGVETTTPSKLDDKYAASSYLSMKKSDLESYGTFTCKVTHEGKTFKKEVNS